MRRSRGNLTSTLLAAPWWVSVALAAFVYVLCQVAPALVHPDRPFFLAFNVLVGLLSRNAHFVALPFLLLAGLSGLSGYRRRRVLDRQSDIESIRELSWQDFELLVGEAYRRQGYLVTENGGGGADGGVDLRLRRDGKTFLAQCKRWKTRQVGVTSIRELYGVMRAEGANGAFFVSSGSYSSDARRFAEENAVTLIDGEGLLQLVRQVQQKAEGAPRAQEAAAVTTSPSCPTCGGAMVLRIARRGMNSGENFWGCVTYPACRGTMSVT